MIGSFGDEATRHVYEEISSKHSRRIPQDLWPVIRRKLFMIELAQELSVLAISGNRLEKLRGDLFPFWSIRVNSQWRVLFLYESGRFEQVHIADYH